MKTTWVCKHCSFESFYSEGDYSAICNCCEAPASQEQILKMNNFFEEEHRREERELLRRKEEERQQQLRREKEHMELVYRNQNTIKRKAGLNKDKVILNIHKVSTVGMILLNAFLAMKTINTITFSNMTLEDYKMLFHLTLILSILWLSFSFFSVIIYALFGSISKRKKYINAIDDKDKYDLTIRQSATKIKNSIVKYRISYLFIGLVFAILSFVILRIN